VPRHITHSVVLRRYTMQINSCYFDVYIITYFINLECCFWMVAKHMGLFGISLLSLFSENILSPLCFLFILHANSQRFYGSIASPEGKMEYEIHRKMRYTFVCCNKSNLNIWTVISSSGKLPLSCLQTAHLRLLIATRLEFCLLSRKTL
jgi:hypothetical protein